MTRKCIICKETNYKNSYSFFSAPKDPETRKKWSDAMGIENYIVSDDTFVCSKHFAPSDIITHWVSGVPPHVVTIKYKKCRLRPGAVPSTSCETMNDLLNSREEEYEEFAVNRGSGIPRRPFFGTNATSSSTSSRDNFSIPREENASTTTNVLVVKTILDEDGAACHTIVDNEEENHSVDNSGRSVYTRMRNPSEQHRDTSSEDTNNSSAVITENADTEQEMAEIVHIVRDEKNFVRDPRDEENRTRIIYVDDEMGEDEEAEVEMEEEEEEEEEPESSFGDKRRSIPDDEDSTIVKSHVSSAEDDSMDMWDTLSNENHASGGVYGDSGCQNTCNDSRDPLAIKVENDCRTMLFEDLLDVYTEVQLPNGWSPIVTSKGHSTTVVYAYMAVTRSGLPYVEKQVFLRSDMKLRCGAADREINPQIHNLVRDGRSRTVRSLADVEELVEEFDQRVVCEGCASEKTRPEETANSYAYRDVSSKWRHVQCPIIVNNGSSRCSKCSTLDASLSHRARARRRNVVAQESAMTRKEKTIRVLHRLLRKTNRKNQRYEAMREGIGTGYEDIASPEYFMTSVDALVDVPRIQKVMMKECLRASLTRNGKSKYSETWVFLCLLLYIESPRMYRYIHANKYMILPSLRIIRRYLHQIKTDKQFYSLFQRTVEPFQPRERDNEKEPT